MILGVVRIWRLYTPVKGEKMLMGKTNDVLVVVMWGERAFRGKQMIFRKD
jgi:hypothetical protein